MKKIIIILTLILLMLIAGIYYIFNPTYIGAINYEKCNKIGIDTTYEEVINFMGQPYSIEEHYSGPDLIRRPEIYAYAKDEKVLSYTNFHSSSDSIRIFIDSNNLVKTVICDEASGLTRK